MYNKIISIPLCIIGICLFVFSFVPYEILTLQIVGIIIALIGFIWMFTSLITTMNASLDQLERFKETIRLQKKLAICISFKEKIEKEFKEILTKTFPNFEKDLVSKFSFENKEAKEAFLAVCPQLESGSSFEKYVDKLDDAIKGIQEVEIEIDEMLAYIAVYNENPWLWFKRKMPTNIQTLIDKFEGEK